MVPGTTDIRISAVLVSKLQERRIHMKKVILSLFVFIAIIALCSCTQQEQPAPQPPQAVNPDIPAVDKMILDPKEWKDKYPLVYESFMKTSMMGDATKESEDLGGQHPIDYLKENPNIAILYEGTGFGKEYYKARGHYYAIEDVVSTARPKPGASCLACKTSEYEKLIVEQGEAVFAKDFQETVQDVEFGITCYNCHRNTPGEKVQITSPQFSEGMKLLKNEPKVGTQACAQCHVEYYFDKKTKQVILPWKNGIGVDEIESYYDEMGFYDWEHPRTGTQLIKVQHPEFEMYSGSAHDTMLVSCVDCHMPKVVENNQEYRSHWAKSPLKTPEESCGKCHGSQAKNMVVEVEKIQKEIDEMEVDVSDKLVKLTKDLTAAIEAKKLDDKTLENLRSLHRKAQYRWDFVFVENSTGFHNETKAKDALNDAEKYAEEALDIVEKL
jgi:nitrite reductase (cytochrome c-552)